MVFISRIFWKVVLDPSESSDGSAWTDVNDRALCLVRPQPSENIPTLRAHLLIYKEASPYCILLLLSLLHFCILSIRIEIQYTPFRYNKRVGIGYAFPINTDVVIL